MVYANSSIAWYLGWVLDALFDISVFPQKLKFKNCSQKLFPQDKIPFA